MTRSTGSLSSTYSLSSPHAPWGRYEVSENSYAPVGTITATGLHHRHHVGIALLSPTVGYNLQQHPFAFCLYERGLYVSSIPLGLLILSGRSVPNLSVNAMHVYICFKRSPFASYCMHHGYAFSGPGRGGWGLQNTKACGSQ